MAKSDKITQAMLDSVAGYGASEAARRLGVHRTSVERARDRASRNGGRLPMRKGKQQIKVKQTGSTLELGADGAGEAETVGTVPQTKADIDALMISKGFDPEEFEYTNIRFSDWDAQTPDGPAVLHSCRVGVRPRVKLSESALSIDELLAIMDRPSFPLVVDTDAEQPEPTDTFVFCFADPQVGKVDINGGTDQLLDRYMNSLHHAEEKLQKEPALHIVWADLGDGIENFCNTSSQRQTNDLNLVEQVRVLRRMQLEGLRRLSKYAPVTHVSVPSNHSQNRVGFQQPASTAHDDWGLEVQEQLAEVFQAAGFQDNPIGFLRPEAHLESASFETPDGTILGFVHGHRAGQQNGLERWWAGQALGRQPTANAHILLSGHFHNWSQYEVGDGRFIITVPSLDGGSSWFTVSRGNVSTAGVLTLRVREGMFYSAERV
jgi:hypothetical protein